MKEPIALTPVARAMFTAAIQSVACPKCNAQRGYYCRKPGGQRYGTIHGERVRAYVASESKDTIKQRHAL